MAIIPYPTFLQPAAPEDIVAFNIEPVGGAQPARYVSWGQAFVAGQVPRGSALVAKMDAATRPAQMDVKTKHPDNSARFAVITVLVPSLAAPAKGMLALGGAIDQHLGVLAALKKYHVTVTLTGGVTATIDVGVKLSEAIRAHAHSYWLYGELAMQARVDLPLKDSLHLVCDVTCYADGSFQSDLQFRNDYVTPVPAGLDAGNTINYTVGVAQNGAVFGATVNHYPSTTWRWVFHSSGPPTSDTHNVQRDIAYFIKAGALQNYDLTTGIDDTSIATRGSTNTAPMVNPGWQTYMPGTGGRDDIGPMPGWYGRWVKCQGWKAARDAIVMGNGAGSIPWHHFDPSTGDYISLDRYPTLWIDGENRGAVDLIQHVTSAWTLDTAHTPDVAFIPYLFTGERYFLDELNAQTSRQLAAAWNTPRQDGLGIVVVGTDAFEVRSQAWTLRNIIEAAWANPDNSATKKYWLKILGNNYDFIVNAVIPDWNNIAGEIAGYFYGNGDGQQAMWMQDYMVSVLGMAVSMRPSSSSRPLKILRWAANFDVGRFTHQAQGVGWATAVSYRNWIATDNTPGRVYFDTWAKLGAANEPGNDLPQDGGWWVPLGLETLATIYNCTGDAQALASYNAVKAADAPGTRAADYQTKYPHFHIVPVNMS